jgi:ElaB/YqjD/DUF883 family membrane-anchored ribosome-binding protein
MTSQDGIQTHSALNARIDSIASELKGVADRLSSAASSLKDRASGVTSHARSSAGSFANRASKAIQDHPIAAIGIALGAGYLLMRLIRR